MENSLSQNISLQQRQLLSQRQQQSLELLHLSLQKLDERIAEELANNPLLEEELPPAGDPIPDTGNGNQEPDTDAQADFEAAQNLWGDDLPAGSIYANRDDDVDFWSRTAAPPPSMDEQLEVEIATSGLSERMIFLAGNIISNLNKSGYLASHLADIAMLCDADMEEMEEALAFVQSFDPPGIAARTLGECLKIQLERKGILTPLLEKLTTDESLKEIIANHIPQLAKKLNISIEELLGAVAELKKLDPAPGAVLSVREDKISEPEIEIVQTNGHYAVKALHRRERSLFISPRYQKLLDAPDTPPDARAYIEEKIRTAGELMESLRLRGDTLTAIGNVLIRTQADFLDSGPEELHPLTMKQAGEMLDLNESTISRAVSGKYVKTPQGIFPLKYFFSSGYKSDDGGDIASRAVQEKIRAFIAAEDPKNPLSDDKIAQLLAKNGIKIARRTVAKYRDILEIPDTRRRKQF